MKMTLVLEKTYRHFTTLVRGEDGKIYDLGKKEYLPKNIMAVNAWTEEIEKAELEINSGDLNFRLLVKEELSGD